MTETGDRVLNETARAHALRSVLLSVAADPEVLAQNIAVAPDLLCVDLEDTVTEKDAVRRLAAEFHTGGYQGRRGVRINPLTEPEGLRDLLFLRDAAWRPDAVVLTKLFDPFELRQAMTLLPGMTFIALIETAEAVECCTQIARAGGTALAALMFGGKDLAYSLGAERVPHALDYARGRMAVAAAATGVRAIDENFRPLDDLTALRAASVRTRAMGYTGRLTIAAPHVEVLHDVFT